MRKLSVFLIICLMSCLSSIALAEPDPECTEDPRACFEGFDDDDTIIPKDDKVKRTFSLPPMKAGFVFDFYHRDLLPHLSMEVVEFSVPKLGDFSLDVGVATSRVLTTLTYEWIPLVKAGPCIWAGYNVREESPAFGIGVAFLDF